MTELVALVLSLTVFTQQPSSLQATDAVSWPIPGVERPGDGVTTPILLHETKPNYTPEAMRARVQGLVVMEWLWFEMTATSIESQSAPAALADRIRTDYDGMHLWTFTTAVNGQSVGVFCAVMHRANSTEADKQLETRRAGAEFGEILQRIAIQPR